MEEIEEQIKRLYEEGKTHGKIAKELNLSLADTRNYLRKLREEGKIFTKKEIKTRNEEARIRERRKKVEILLNNNDRTREEIAQELGISVTIVGKDILYLEGQEGTQKILTNQRIEERRKKVKILLNNNGRTRKEIAQELGISLTTLRKDILYLEEQEGTQKIPTSQKIEERRKKVEKLYIDKTQKEIADELGVSPITIERDINFLRREGKIDDGQTRMKSIKQRERRKDKVEVRKKQIQNLYELGKTQTEIAKELHVSQPTVSNNIKQLKKEGILIEELRKSKKRHIPRTNRRKEQIKLLYEAGKTQMEIAKELHVSQPTVSNNIKELKKEGKIPKLPEKKIKQQEIREKTKERVKELYIEGKTYTEIANELGVSTATINREIKKHGIVRGKGELESAEKLTNRKWRN